MDAVICKAPQTEPGSTFAYSNAGYVFVGAILERASGQMWEDLLRARLFRSLGMSSAGFGTAAKESRLDQPGGHHLKDGKLVPSNTDNVPAIGPAGTVHCTVGDYLKFADFHASAGTRPGGLLKQESLQELHTAPSGSTCAMGWGTGTRPWARGRVLSHAGSNGANYIIAWLAPEIGLSMAVATNAAGDGVPEALDKVCSRIATDFGAP